jgi:hypothetical protein
LAAVVVVPQWVEPPRFDLGDHTAARHAALRVAVTTCFAASLLLHRQHCGVQCVGAELATGVVHLAGTSCFVGIFTSVRHVSLSCCVRPPLLQAAISLWALPVLSMPWCLSHLRGGAVMAGNRRKTESRASTLLEIDELKVRMTWDLDI